MALNQVKSMYQTLRTYFTMVEEDFGHMSVFGPYPYASIFGGEVCKFAYYMAAADGRLDERERLYINEITGYGENTQQMIETMKQSGVVMEEERDRFAQTPFKCLMIALAADAVYKESGRDSDLLKMTLTFFVLLGSDLMSVDGNISPEEQASLQAVVDTMQTIAQEAYLESQKEAAGEESKEEEPAEEAPAEEEPAEEPAKEALAEEAPAEEDPVEEASVDEVSSMEELEKAAPEVSNDNAPNVLGMSVEEIVAEVNGVEKGIDILKGLELSIGENGASYIALKLPAEKRAMIHPELLDKDVPILFVGNTVCASYEDQIVKKHILKGVCSVKTVAAEVVESMNYSVSASATTNQMKMDSNEALMDVVNDMLGISENTEGLERLNTCLEDKKSALRIVQSENGEYAVRDYNQANHSLEEVLWVLSF